MNEDIGQLVQAVASKLGVEKNPFPNIDDLVQSKYDLTLAKNFWELICSQYPDLPQEAKLKKLREMMLRAKKRAKKNQYVPKASDGANLINRYPERYDPHYYYRGRNGRYYLRPPPLQYTGDYATGFANTNFMQQLANVNNTNTALRDALTNMSKQIAINDANLEKRITDALNRRDEEMRERSSTDDDDFGGNGNGNGGGPGGGGWGGGLGGRNHSSNSDYSSSEDPGNPGIYPGNLRHAPLNALRNLHLFNGRDANFDDSIMVEKSSDNRPINTSSLADFDDEDQPDDANYMGQQAAYYYRLGKDYQNKYNGLLARIDALKQQGLPVSQNLYELLDFYQRKMDEYYEINYMWQRRQIRREADDQDLTNSAADDYISTAEQSFNAERGPRYKFVDRSSSSEPQNINYRRGPHPPPDGAAAPVGNFLELVANRVADRVINDSGSNSSSSSSGTGGSGGGGDDGAASTSTESVNNIVIPYANARFHAVNEPVDIAQFEGGPIKQEYPVEISAHDSFNNPSLEIEGISSSFSSSSNNSILPENNNVNVNVNDNGNAPIVPANNVNIPPQMRLNEQAVIDAAKELIKPSLEYINRKIQEILTDKLGAFNQVSADLNQIRENIKHDHDTSMEERRNKLEEERRYLRDQEAAMTNKYNQFNTKATDLLNSNTRKMLETYSNHTKTLEAASLDLARQYGENVKDIKESFDTDIKKLKNIVEDAQKNIDEQKNSNNVNQEQIKKMQDVISKTKLEIAELYKQEVEELAKSRAAAEAAYDELNKTTIENLEKVVAKANENITNANNTYARTNNLITNFATNREAITAQQLQNALASMSQLVQGAQTDIANYIAPLIAEMKNTTALFSGGPKASTEVQNALNNAYARLTSLATQAGDDIIANRTNAGTVIDTLKKEIEAIKTSLQTDVTKRNELTSEDKLKIATITSELTRLTESVKALQDQITKNAASTPSAPSQETLKSLADAASNFALEKYNANRLAERQRHAELRRAAYDALHEQEGSRLRRYEPTKNINEAEIPTNQLQLYMKINDQLIPINLYQQLNQQLNQNNQNNGLSMTIQSPPEPSQKMVPSNEQASAKISELSSSYGNTETSLPSLSAFVPSGNLNFSTERTSDLLNQPTNRVQSVTQNNSNPEQTPAPESPIAIRASSPLANNVINEASEAMEAAERLTEAAVNAYKSLKSQLPNSYKEHSKSSRTPTETMSITSDPFLDSNKVPSSSKSQRSNSRRRKESSIEDASTPHHNFNIQPNETRSRSRQTKPLTPSPEINQKPTKLLLLNTYPISLSPEKSQKMLDHLKKSKQIMYTLQGFERIVGTTPMNFPISITNKQIHPHWITFCYQLLRDHPTEINTILENPQKYNINLVEAAKILKQNLDKHN